MGILHGWRHCPRCTAALDNDGSVASCPGCGFVTYASSAPAVSALVLDDEGRVLLARRAHEPDAGLWDVPGGFLDEGEHPRDGLRRELREEAGLDVEPGAFAGAYLDTYGAGAGAASVLNLVYDARIRSGRPVPADDVAELAWFAPDALPPSDECAFTWVSAFLRDWAGGRTPPG
jgi:ADP-ribose pyrophosphatase YjhB (NUDIX family)